ncbi:MAG: PAS domain S-box protein [Armatimonadetes bacterium]|nr:PAS domain S-box protein [Armatimonadota bacterium]
MSLIIETVVIAALYYGTARLGQLTAIPPGNVTPVWPPSGLALAAVLLRGCRALPGIWLGAFFGNTWALLEPAGAISVAPIAVGVVIAVGSTLQAVLGALLIRRFIGGPNPFQRTQGVFAFLGIEVLSVLVSPTFGVTSLTLGGLIGWNAYAYTWATWWIGDFVGIIVLAPVLLLWAEQPRISIDRRRATEAGLFLASLIMVTWMIFAEGAPFATVHRPLAYWVVPLLIWSAVRFGQRDTMTVVLLVSGAILFYTMRASGPFAGVPLLESLWMMTGFLGVTTVTTLTLSTVIAERQRIEDRLEESEELYRTLFERSPSGVLLFDPDTARPILFNDVAHRQLGYSREEFAQMSIFDYQALETPEETREHIKQVLEEGSYQFETRHRAKDGSIRDMVVGGKVIDLRGRIVILGIERDITDVKQAEERLRKERDRAETYFDCARVIMIVLASDGTVERINEKGCEVLGYSEDEICGKQWLDTFVPESIRDETVSVFRKLLAGELVPERFVNPIVTKGGEERIIDWRNTLLYDESGNITSTLSSGEDITERMAAEEQVRAAALYARGLIETSLDPLVTISPDGKITDVNAATERVTGVPRDELIGADFSDFFTEPEKAREGYRLVFEKGLVTDYPLSIRHVSGRVTDVLYNAAVYRDEEGSVAGVFAAARDVTDLKQAERERLAHLRFVESLDLVNRAMMGTNDLEQTMSDVLDVVLSVFDCDRAWLLYPSDPEATTFKVPMERTKPECPGAFELGLEIPVDAEAAEVFRAALASSSPLKFGPGYELPVPAETVRVFGVRSQILMAIYPKVGKAWLFGLHQCSYPRVWTPEEERLFQEVGRRLSDSLGSLVTYRELQESEERYRGLVELSPDGILIHNVEGIILFVNSAGAALLGARNPDELVGRSITDTLHPDYREAARERVHWMSEHGQGWPMMERKMIRLDGTVFDAEAAAAPLTYRGKQATMVVFRDITGRKRVEQIEREADKRQREFYRRTILAATDGKLVVCDREEIRSIAGPPAASWEISMPADVGPIRDATAKFAKSAGMDEARTLDLLFCAGEAITNAYKHANGGTASIHVVPGGLMLVVSDEGRGMEALTLPELALVKGYSTIGTLGMGYKIMISLADKVYLATGPTGTTVGIEMAADRNSTPLEDFFAVQQNH